MKIITYNVNGLRSAINKGWMQWLQAVNPDIVCLQEIKVQTEQLDLTIFEKAGYHHYWHPAEKKGYSGVAILSKEKPNNVMVGSGEMDIDKEGRIIRADYGDVSVNPESLAHVKFDVGAESATALLLRTLLRLDPN